MHWGFPKKTICPAKRVHINLQTIDNLDLEWFQPGRELFPLLIARYEIYIKCLVVIKIRLDNIGLHSGLPYFTLSMFLYWYLTMTSCREIRSDDLNERRGIKKSVAIFGLSANPPTGDEVLSCFQPTDCSYSTTITIVTHLFKIWIEKGHAGIVKNLVDSGSFDEGDYASQRIWRQIIFGSPSSSVPIISLFILPNDFSPRN